MKVAVIGAGAMGRWLVGFAKQNLGEVTVSDIDTTKANRIASELGVSSKPVEEAVTEANLVLVAVPISKTPEAVKSLAGMARKGTLIVDVASVKGDVVEAMQELEGNLELVSIHPLFGPGATSVKGKDFVVIPVKKGKHYAKLKQVLAGLGAHVTEMEADEHDRLMSIIQCMTHFVLIAYLSAIKSMRGLKAAEKLRTPMFATLMKLAKAVLSGNPELYGELQVQNRYARVVRSSMLEACRSLNVAFSAGNSKSAKTMFKEALAPFGAEEAKRSYEELYKQFEGEGE